MKFFKDINWYSSNFNIFFQEFFTKELDSIDCILINNVVSGKYELNFLYGLWDIIEFAGT